MCAVNNLHAVCSSSTEFKSDLNFLSSDSNTYYTDRLHLISAAALVHSTPGTSGLFFLERERERERETAEPEAVYFYVRHSVTTLQHLT